MATGALITDPQGRILLVKPNYRPHWLIPGGMADDGEPPESACARELDEELGLRASIGRLLVADWAPRPSTVCASSSTCCSTPVPCTASASDFSTPCLTTRRSCPPMKQRPAC
ncbi:NUDIX domain-containing protein [Nonomuraea sp. NPDC003560]|uniref:NUDIX domain-containing protein n=1 Tax=Nonomuraea sp. NPDC003560 TaxID=3364341 RepID=UPI0036C0643E